MSESAIKFDSVFNEKNITSDNYMEFEPLFNEEEIYCSNPPFAFIENKKIRRMVTDPPDSFLCETRNKNKYGQYCPYGCDIVNTYFTLSAIYMFKRLAKVLEKHSAFREIVENMNPILIEELDTIFEQKLAMYITIKIKYKHPDTELYFITEIDILDEIIILLHKIISRGKRTFPRENTFKHMLNGYPISLLNSIYLTKTINPNIIGESLRTFIKARTIYKHCLPHQLNDFISGNIPLIGHPSSPLTKDELDALYQYLGSRKPIYVHILLNTLFQLNEHDKLLTKSILTETELTTIIQSSWLYLFLFAIKPKYPT